MADTSRGKVCNRCKTYKMMLEFSLNKNSTEGRKSICKVCSNKAQKALYKRRREEDPEAHTLKLRKQTLMKGYGLTLEDFDRMLEAHNHVCAICGKPESFRENLTIDHCHTTGRVRGLLCTNCNSAIGKLGDTSVAVSKAVAYLQRFENGLL